ncbi:protein of unknown function (plasmid) [Cupriavidus taiwanensis]|uniref:Cyclic nucleotide-binding domain-containing protein n=1 Tax=Cupriavidus taiwanensis TaxID=164546 RepID=A0A375ED13_9BURK|nr:protein of unknown function [Cupriavidus taiwanensis]SOZ72414.1 protein of unknown function [Cupriavidus taiwanensis]SOZ74784.1 protein of unknown function [Cupriavidus taiwanensis]SPA03616.1 protein of unknown function [Cupriavidus taiwanensis]SPA11517.1 protein of unknown function [Cupriavidus taiwanensis]
MWGRPPTIFLRFNRDSSADSLDADYPPAICDRVRADLYETRHQKAELVVRMGDPSHSWILCADGLLKVSAVDAAGRMLMYTVVPQKDGLVRVQSPSESRDATNSSRCVRASSFM